MNLTCLDEELSSAASIVLSLWSSLSGLAAVTGNAVVLWLLYKHESLRTISNRFLASLSVADFLVGLVIDPAWITIRCLIQPSEVTQTALVKVMDMLWIHTTAATTFNLCCVSVDRFIAIRFPFRYQDILTKKKCYTLVAAVWTTSFLLPFPVIFVDVEKMWLLLSLITFCIPTTIVAVCYFWIFKAARKQARRITRPENQRNTTERNAIQNFKAIKTIGLVLGVFVASWMPCLIVSIVHQIVANDPCVDNKLYAVVWPWIEAIALSSSAINPWIYYFRNSEFREALCRSFHQLNRKLHRPVRAS